MADAPVKKSDFVKTYVWGMGLIALVLAVAWFKVSRDRDAFHRANEAAPVVFGKAHAEGAPLSELRPTTVTSLALGILKYLHTYKDARIKPEDMGKGIQIQPIRDRAQGAGLSLKNIPQEQSNPMRAKGYEEVYATFMFEPTDLDRLAQFLYNFEISSRLRVLELRWDLRPDKENPLVPGVSWGHLIQSPNVKIGYRRAISRS
jgi:hypothetical protein